MTRWKSSSGSYRKELFKILRASLILMLPIILLLSSFYYWMYNEDYFAQQFTENNVYPSFYAKRDVLLQENHDVMQYLKSGSGMIESQFFDAKEKSHLADVRIVMQSAAYALIIVLVIWLVGIYFYRKDAASIIYRGGLLSLLLFLLLLLCALNFELAFTYFHKLFFADGSWMFEPTENLVRMYPERFFYNTAKNILLTFGALGAVITSMARLSLSYIRCRRTARHQKSL